MTGEEWLACVLELTLKHTWEPFFISACAAAKTAKEWETELVTELFMRRLGLLLEVFAVLHVNWHLNREAQLLVLIWEILWGLCAELIFLVMSDSFTHLYMSLCIFKITSYCMCTYNLFKLHLIYCICVCLFVYSCTCLTAYMWMSEQLQKSVVSFHHGVSEPNPVTSLGTKHRYPRNYLIGSLYRHHLNINEKSNAMSQILQAILRLENMCLALEIWCRISHRLGMEVRTLPLMLTVGKGFSEANLQTGTFPNAKVR